MATLKARRNRYGFVRLLLPPSALDHGRVHVVLPVVMGSAIALGAFVGVSWAAGFSAVLHRFVHPHWWWFFVALAAEALSYAGYVFAYREVARVERGPDFGLPRLAALVATGFGIFVAGGGFAVDLEALRRSGISPREARVRVLGLGALEYAVLAPAACIASVVLILEGERHGPSAGFIYPWALGVPVGFALAFAALRFRDRVTGSRGWRNAVSHALDGVNVLRHLATAPRDHGAAAYAGTALYWFGDILCLWATLHAFLAHGFGISQMIVGYATGYALTRRTLPFAGAGAVEALLPFALLWAGAPLAAAVLAVFTYRVFNLWLPIVPAVGGLKALRRMDEARRRTQRAWED